MAPTMVSEAMPDATRILMFFSSVDRVTRVNLRAENPKHKPFLLHSSLEKERLIDWF